MNRPTLPGARIDPLGPVPDSPRDGIWAGLIGVVFVASMAVAYRPDLGTAAGVVLAALPWFVLGGMIGAWAGRTLATRLVAVSIAIAGWAVLILDDDRWSLLSFALYGLCFIVHTRRLALGVALAGIVSAVWALASIGGPVWTVLIPLFVFTATSTIAFAIHRIGALTARQARLIAELEAAQADLAESERSRGVLEERARLAGEIHDTLAQGFASIVLLARVGRRSPSDTPATFDSIEATAQENLDTARRLVESAKPAELDHSPLPDALRRHLREALPDSVTGHVAVVGEPRALPGATDTVLLRTAQEGLRNALQHARPSRVDIALSYLDEGVSLSVADDGEGFESGLVNDRGTLTGGQGLATLARRVESLAGEMHLDHDEEQGTVLTVRLPDRP